MKDARDMALMLVGRDLLARASELVSLTREAVALEPDGTATVNMRRHKTSTETETYHLGADAAAAAALKLWLEGAGITSGPIWRTVNKAGCVGEGGIAPREVSRALRGLVDRAKIDADFTGHSLRVGMAQDLTADNFELPAVMMAGGWTTPRMVARYTRKLAAGRGAVAQYQVEP